MRHIWRWKIPRVTSGTGQNNTWRCYNGSIYSTVTVDADTADTTCWTSIAGLADKLEDALRALGGDYATAAVTVDAATGIITVTGGAGLIGPAPSTDSQKAFDVLLGGTGAAGTPAASYVFPAIAAGQLIAAYASKDTGDLAGSVQDVARRLDGTAVVHSWGTSTKREISYRFLTSAQYARYRELVTQESAILDAREQSTFSGTSYAIITADPDYELVAPGLAYYHASLEVSPA